MKWINMLNGYIKIKVEGASPERFLNLCHKQGITLWNLTINESIYEVNLSISDFKTIRPLARKTKTRITILEKHGFPFFLFRFRKRKVFFLGILLSIIIVCGLSGRIWNIRIQGNMTQTTDEILEFLDTRGISHGTKKSRISCEEIETGLRKNYSNMLWVSAELRGTRIIIKIKENTDKDIISEIKDKNLTASSIVAECSGIIDSILVREGTPMVRPGNYVKKGDLLVAGYYEIKNDAQEVVRYESVCADADISILCSETYFDKFSTVSVEKEYTGRKRLGIRLIYQNKAYLLKPHISFKEYEASETIHQFSITESFNFPIKIGFIHYLEYNSVTKKLSSSELKSLAEQRFYNKYKNNIQKGVQIIEKDVKIDINGKLCHVKGNVKLLFPNTKKVPVILPEQENAASLEGENKI